MYAQRNPCYIAYIHVAEETPRSLALFNYEYPYIIEEHTVCNGHMLCASIGSDKQGFRIISPVMNNCLF